MARNKPQEKTRLKNWLKTVLPDDWNKIDVDKTFDESLDFDGNKKLLIDKISLVVTEKKLEKIKKTYEDNKKAEAVVKDVDKKLKRQKKALADKFEEKYQPIYRSINKMCQGYTHLLFVKGRPGIGKTTNIRHALHKNGMQAERDYIEVTGEVTEAYLYRLIYENNGQIIWLQDVSNMLSSMKNVNLLKAATETEKIRLLTKNNYSHQQDGLPDRFLCESAFIFDYNTLQGVKLREDFEALVSRGDFKEIIFDNDEIKEIMRLIAKTPLDKAVTELVIQEFEGNGLVRLNLRTQHKAIQTAKWAKKNGLDWMKEVKEDIKHVSEVRALIHSLIGPNPTTVSDLKKIMLKQGAANSINTASRRIKEWIFLEELYVWDANKRNNLVCINPKPKEDEQDEAKN